jgi:glycosidase
MMESDARVEATETPTFVCPIKKEGLRFDPKPDYTRPIFELPLNIRERVLARLRRLYGEEKAKETLPELERVLKVHHAHKPPEMIEKEQGFNARERFTEKDSVLITYGDLFRGGERTPLSTLHQIIKTHNRGGFNTIHLLPFFPYSSDRGFAVIDFKQVDPNVGTWEDIMEMEACYDLMFDGVLNHCSSRSEMFREFLNDNPIYKDYFIAYDSPDDLTPDQRSKIFRPRTSDILTKFHTINGAKYVWTTFSADQIDLNFRNPHVLLSVIGALLFYVRRGADIIRLDAVTYIWAEPGTECVHLPETHEIVKLMRDVMDAVAPGVALITETNVPHEDNVSYFGNGYDEAHMVYNFALPPLVLYTFYKGDATALSNWASQLVPPSEFTTFFNILDTHDGIGLMGVKGILPKVEIEVIMQNAKQHGGYVSYKTGQDGKEEPYEINCTWWSAVNRDQNDEPLELQVKRFIASRSIALVLKGVPGSYVHGILGTLNNHELAEKTGVKRDINRSFIDGKDLQEAFGDPDSKLSLMRRLGSTFNLVRSGRRAFHPRGKQKVLMFAPEVFSVLRTSPEGDQAILALTNVTGKNVTLDIPLQELGHEFAKCVDLLVEKTWAAEGSSLHIVLAPYDVLWLRPGAENG